MVYYQDSSVTLHRGDALETLREMPSGSVNCVVTSPPYFGLRDYGIAGQYGLESSLDEYVKTMRDVFSEVRRVLADAGTLWLNVGDSYVTGATGSRVSSGLCGTPNSANTPAGFGAKGGGGLPSKSLLGVPWRVAFALQDDGWLLRNDIIWHKPNAMPQSAQDRMAGKYEHVFLFAKKAKYHLRLDAYRLEPKVRNTRGVHPNGANPGDVWSIHTKPLNEDHPGAFPVELPSRCIAMGCPPGGVVLDPFSGAGTTGLAALRFHRKYIGIELNPEYLELSIRRLAKA